MANKKRRRHCSENNVKYIPTKILKEILDDAPYYRTATGYEGRYFEMVQTIRNVLADRSDRKMQAELRAYENQELERKKYEADANGQKYCPKCDSAKDINEFSCRSDNKALRRSHCKACNNAHARKMREANKVPF